MHVNCFIISCKASCVMSQGTSQQAARSKVKWGRLRYGHASQMDYRTRQPKPVLGSCLHITCVYPCRSKLQNMIQHKNRSSQQARIKGLFEDPTHLCNSFRTTRVLPQCTSKAQQCPPPDQEESICSWQLCTHFTFV